MAKRKRALFIGGAAALAVVVLVTVAVLTSQKRPPECAAAQFAGIAQLQSSPYATTSVRLANEAIERAMKRADAEDRRLFVLRRYDAALCREAKRAFDAAGAAVVQAQAQRGHVSELAAQAEGHVAVAQQQMAAAIGWLEAGIVNDDVVAKLRAGRLAVDDAVRAVERSKGALEAAGYEGSVGELEAAAAQAATQATQAAELARAAKAEATARCVPKSKGKSYDVTVAKAFEDWVILRGDHASFVFARDSDRKRCSLMHASIKAGDAIMPGADVDESLFVWHVPGMVDTKILVGWAPHHAWFLARDADWRAYSHATGCTAAGDGCAPPAFVDKALESRCACAASERPVNARYLWDGHAVIVEN